MRIRDRGIIYQFVTLWNHADVFALETVCLAFLIEFGVIVISLRTRGGRENYRDLETKRFSKDLSNN